jgi:streptomycin 6-kinase
MIENLNHYLDLWELSDPQLLAETVTSQVYTVTSNRTRVILKLLKEYGSEERNGAIALGYWDGRGAVRLLRVDEQAHLLEYAAGEDLIGMVKNGQDEEATAIIAGVLNQLHAESDRPLPEGLVPLKRWFRALFKKADADRAEGRDSVYVRGARVAEALLAEPRDVTVLHGDIHHENVRYQAQRGWLAFDPKGLIGERTYDAANTLCNPGWMTEVVENEKRLLRTAAILAQKLDIELSRVLAFTYAYVCLSASWYAEDGQYGHYLRQNLIVAGIIEPHI